MLENISSNRALAARLTDVATMQRLPPLNALRAFDAVASTGSFKAAAEALGVTQSAISHQIKGLEAHLGTFLFHRQPRGIELTGAGSQFHAHVRAGFAEIERGVRRVGQDHRGESLTIQTYSTIAVRWLVPRLQGFQARHPRLVIRLVTAQNDPTFADEAVDLGLVIGRPGGARLTSTYLFSPMLFPVCAPALAARLARPADLAGVPLLQVYPSGGDWPCWLAAQGVEGIDPDRGMRFDSYDHALRMAARGHGVALAMQPYVAEELAAGTLVRAFPGCDVPAPTAWQLVCPEARSDHRHIRAFRQWALDEVLADPELAGLRHEAGSCPAE
ncbi:MAG: LysR family transcriptional regulator [Proteobacteria bacterium]|nr:LysR family transcriptional regulator [Pseudomonadota bacterium]